MPAHLSSAELLAWLDGELSAFKRFTASRHLRSCWECRNRIADLADTIRLAPSVLPKPPVDRVRVARANWSFRESVRLFEAEKDLRRRQNPRQRLAAGVALTLAIAAVVAAPLVINRGAVEPVSIRSVPRVTSVPARRQIELPPAAPATVRSGEPAAVPVFGSPIPKTAEVPLDDRALTSAELDVWSILHRSRLCLTGEISVRRSSADIEISGVLPSEDRKTQLLALLATARRHDLLHINLRTTADVPAGAMEPAVHIGAMPSEAPAESWLRGRMRVGDVATQREMFDVMNAIVTGSQGLLGEAWALRRLGERFSVEVERALSEPERAELHAIAEDHALAVQARIEAISQMLRPLGVSLPSRDTEPGGGEWQSASMRLQQRAADYAGSLLSLFTAGGPGRAREPVTVETEIARVAAGLSEVSGLAARERSDLAPALRSSGAPAGH